LPALFDGICDYYFFFLPLVYVKKKLYLCSEFCKMRKFRAEFNLKTIYIIMKVGVIMGSTSDLDVMTPAIETLEQFGIEVEKRVISAHRAPHELMRWTESARERGLSIIIAGAGGAAHLAGVIAGLTSLPVIGVPVRSKTLDGLDSLLSIVQMPAGIPVATVAINGSKNAALLAIAILALQDAELLAKLEAFRREQTEKVVNTVI
jgi:5-(carboxyamino)imidazole ribonucleotide mutase